MQMEDSDKVPNYVAKLFADCNINFALCKQCQKFATSVQQDTSRYYPQGTCLQLNCYTKDCSTSSWHVCTLCNKRLTRSGVKNHFLTSAEHKRSTIARLASTSMEHVSEDPLPVSPSDASQYQMEPDSYTPMIADSTKSPNKRDLGTSKETDRDINACLDTSTMANTYKVQAPDWRNDWLEQLLSDTPIASIDEISSSFSSSSEAMSMFWAAEAASPPRCCGGGAQYLVARAFCENDLFIRSNLPTLSESKFHILNLTQHQSMSQKQRQRQSDLHGFYKDNGFAAGLYCDLDYEALGNFYNSKGQHSLWNNIPIPKVDNMNGIAYVSPENILRYCYANGISVDDTFVEFKGPTPTYPKALTGKQAIFHVSQTRAAEEALQSVAEAGRNIPGYPDHVVVNLVSDWRDGFGPSRTKNNRKSVLLWTLTIGAPKDRSNSGQNTFVLALGSKNNRNWAAVERRFARDMRAVSDPSKPLFVYHGRLRKMVPTVMKRIASIEDKPERADITSTLEGGGYHRCFGKLFHLDPPVIDHGIHEYVKERKAGNRDSDRYWGWTYPFIQSKSSNGGRLVSCVSCRRKRLVLLGLSVDLDDYIDATEGDNCVNCADWDLDDPIRRGMLTSPVPPYYPDCEIPGCPVPFPEGRKPTDKSGSLPVVDITFDFLVQACKVAFYSCSQPKVVWAKGRCISYLRTCGVNAETAGAVYDAAFACRIDSDEFAAVDYTSTVGLGEVFKYPASWHGDIKIQDYIETVMHQVFIGIAKSQMELIDRYLVVNGLGMETFRRQIQPLLKELKNFQLSWLMIMPFNTGKSDDKHTTGSWMGENWAAYTRISNIVHSWVRKDGMKSVRQGCLDVARTVMVYHAFTSRLLTHSGLNEEKINECSELLKEFMSCVMELDIRVRYKELTRAKATNPKPSASSPSEPPRHPTSKSRKAPQSKKKPPPPEPEQSKTKGPPEPFWYKPNYFSLFNLIEMMKKFGPVCNWWDGGGKCEKGIQEVKPFITRGIPDNESFFFHLMKRIYKMRQLEEMETMYLPGKTKTHEDEPMEKKKRLTDLVEEELNDMNVLEVLNETNPATLSDQPVGNSDDYHYTYDVENEEERDYCEIEDQMMAKSRTVFIYKTPTRFHDALPEQHRKPLSGILIDDGSGLSFFCVVRTGRGSLGWSKISFDDSNGEEVHGMWYAPIIVGEMDEHDGCPSTPRGVQDIAKMSAVAIPLWYIVGRFDRLSSKYCVITNWWKPRDCRGRYTHPKLDFSVYEATA